MPKREQLEELLKADPDDVFLHYALAMAIASEGDAELAQQRLQDVIDRDPNYVAAYFQRGQVLAGQGATAAAREVLVQGIATAQRVGDLHAEQEMRGFLESLN